MTVRSQKQREVFMKEQKKSTQKIMKWKYCSWNAVPVGTVISPAPDG